MALTQVQSSMLNGSTNTTTTIQSNGTTAITIDSSQNVGIGTTSPGSSLDVQAVDGRSIIRLTATTNTNPVYSRASNAGGYLYLGRDGSAGSDFGAGAYSAGIWSTGAYPMVFGTNGTERMRIDSSGNLLVGTTAQLYSTPSRVNISFDNSNSYAMTIKASGAGSFGVAYFINSAGTIQGTISCSGSGATTYATSSDYRLKDNIAPMTNALDTVSALKPVTYKWKSDGSKSQGFIAHELQEICPEAVVGEKDAVNEDGSIIPQGIDTSFLVATLTAAIQELKAQVDAQAAEIQALKAK
jgi:hypothetical protein